MNDIEIIEEIKKAYARRKGISFLYLSDLPRIKILEEKEKRYNKLVNLLLDPIIIPTHDQKNLLRPIKGTTKQEVYHTLLKAQEIMEIPGKWIPWEKRNIEKKDIKD